LLKREHKMSAVSISSPHKADWIDLVLRILLLGLILFAVALGLAFCGFELWYQGRIYPGVSLSGIDLSGLKPPAAAEKISSILNFSQNGRIIFQDGKQSWLAGPTDLGFSLDAVKAADAAYQIGRQAGPIQNLSDQLQAWWTGYNLSPTIVFDQRITLRYVQALAKQIDKPMIEANIGLNGPEVVVHKGQVGRSLDVDRTLTLISAQLQSLQDGTILLPVKETPPLVMDPGQQAEVARRILNGPLTLVLPDGAIDAGPWTFDQNTLASMLTIERVTVKGVTSYQITINNDNLRAFLSKLAPSLALTSQNARFTFNDQSHQLELLQHATIGRSLDVEGTLQVINEKLLGGEHTIPLIYTVLKPPVNDDSTGESLGVTQLIQSTTSYFYGSSAERVQNIKTAAGQFHGLLIAPGETFSMAQALGNISLDNGYAEALIIVGNQTIKGVGGGVCQVSTTLFRTAFFAGLPINERHAHAYRVSYYEQKSNGNSNPDLAGLDATVFVPLVDFKFTNDTPNWLLMETYVKGYSLTWKFYSKSDGRTVAWETTGPTNKVAPPDPSYKENPDLKKGQIKQVDWAAEGAYIAVTRTVSRDGKVILTDHFNTQYEPWQAKYEYGPGTEDIPTPAPNP
jgi:vancomycin resistance protein YoaR